MVITQTVSSFIGVCNQEISLYLATYLPLTTKAESRPFSHWQLLRWKSCHQPLLLVSVTKSDACAIRRIMASVLGWLDLYNQGASLYWRISSLSAQHKPILFLNEQSNQSYTIRLNKRMILWRHVESTWKDMIGLSSNQIARASKPVFKKLLKKKDLQLSTILWLKIQNRVDNGQKTSHLTTYRTLHWIW